MTGAYREEVKALVKWCRENNLSLNINKMMELIVDFRRQQRENVHIDGATVEV
jgi:threonine aldolase